MPAKSQARILIVDDEEDILLSLQFFLSEHFTEVTTEHNPYQLARLLRQNDYELILLDMNFKKGDTSGQAGLQWLSKILELKPTANVVMITAYAEVQTAVEAVKRGAVDFIEKPWRNQKLLATLLSALELSRSKQKVQQLEQKQKVLQHEIEQPFDTMIGQSPAMQRVRELVEKVGKTDASILILGENGTGKELVARAIHRASPRSNNVFVKVDIGAIPESLFESELFGHKKGAFTDAFEDRSGRFEVASGGTLFLDEIGNLNLPLQAKLLTALQNRAIQKVGTSTITPIDIRLISATNKPLYEMVAEDSFRQDLLYRLNTVEITLPPLRQRLEDLPELLQHFLSQFSLKYQKPNLELKPEALQALQSYHWPGNIRELQHAVERAVILSESSRLGVSDFILKAPAQKATPHFNPPTLKLEELEKWAIRNVLTRQSGNISKAAEELGLTRAALYRRMAKYGL